MRKFFFVNKLVSSNPPPVVRTISCLFWLRSLFSYWCVPQDTALFLLTTKSQIHNQYRIFTLKPDSTIFTAYSLAVHWFVTHQSSNGYPSLGLNKIWSLRRALVILGLNLILHSVSRHRIDPLPVFPRSSLEIVPAAPPLWSDDPQRLNCFFTRTMSRTHVCQSSASSGHWSSWWMPVVWALHYPWSFRLSFMLSSCAMSVERQFRGCAWSRVPISHITISSNTINNLVDQHWIIQGTVVRLVNSIA